MPNRVRFDHDVLTETGQHVITSPDIKGFCIVGDTGEEVERDAIEMLALIARLGLPLVPGNAAIERESV